MIFICEKFEGKVFNYLKQKGFRLELYTRTKNVRVFIIPSHIRILGPPCVLASAIQQKVIHYFV